MASSFILKSCDETRCARRPYVRRQACFSTFLGENVVTGLGLLYLGGTTLSRGLLGLLGVGLRFIFAKQLGRDLKQAALSRFGAVWRADKTAGLAIAPSLY